MAMLFDRTPPGHPEWPLPGAPGRGPQWTINLVLTTRIVYLRIALVTASCRNPPSALGLLRQPAQAAALLYHPVRIKILAALVEPDSATGVARRMNLPRQTVNYHVRELARAKLLARAGRRRRRR